MKKQSTVPFAHGFVPRTKSEVQEALGNLPWDTSSRKRLREEHLSKEGGERLSVETLEQLDQICYYSNFDSSGKPVWKDLPNPTDDGCWLANFVEAGQTFEEYVNFVTLRSGKIKKQVTKFKPIIYILPIVNSVNMDKVQSEIDRWPSAGPDLKLLAEWVQAFFDRDVIILDAATIHPVTPAVPKRNSRCDVVFRTPDYEVPIPGRLETKEGHLRFQTHVDGLLGEMSNIRTENRHKYTLSDQIEPLDKYHSNHSLPTSNSVSASSSSSSSSRAASGSKSRDTAAGTAEVIDLTLSPPVSTSVNNTTSSSRREGALYHNSDTSRVVLVDCDSSSSSSSSSSDHKDGKGVIHDASLVLGITMEDLFSSDGDLFVAGMAAGGSSVAVLSFGRYHPRMKMHFQNWEDYGYASRSSDYSYFEEGKARPKLAPSMPALQAMDAASQATLLRRAGKVVVHELAHVFGLDHCVYYHCIMNGTGHLVEDFAAPAHLCGVCLRKLQFRQGFDVLARYTHLQQVYSAGGLGSEAAWVKKRIASLQRQKQLTTVEKKNL
jgi:predicted Zn-dependent protease